MSFALAKVLDKPDVAAAAALLAERVANHTCSEQNAHDQARYHAYIEETVDELVDGAVRGGEVEGYRDWAEGYELQAGADLQRDRVAGL